MPGQFRTQPQDLIVDYGVHLDAGVQDSLAALPRGWLGVVRGMLDRVEQILCGSEEETFRWQVLGRQQDRLIVQWDGAVSSSVLIDQICEEAVDEARRTCMECGASNLVALWDPEGPRCLFHATLRSGLGRIREWNVSGLELVRVLHGSFGSNLPVNLHPKTIAAALPMLIREAGIYFRQPDQDATAIAQQLQEALIRLDQQILSRTRSGLGLVKR